MAKHWEEIGMCKVYEHFNQLVEVDIAEGQKEVSKVNMIGCDQISNACLCDFPCMHL